MSRTRRSNSAILSFLVLMGRRLGPTGEKTQWLPFREHRLQVPMGDSGSGTQRTLEMWHESQALLNRWPNIVIIPVYNLG